MQNALLSVRSAWLVLCVLTGLMLATGCIESGADSRVVMEWNNEVPMRLPLFDTGNMERQCVAAAPWGSQSWGIEAATFSDAADRFIAAARFRSFENHVYVYGKEDQGRWGFARYVQGDIWGGSNCGDQIPWHLPRPLRLDGRNPTVQLDIHRDTTQLDTPDNSWVMLALNVWVTSPEFPPGPDKTGHKPLVMDLSFYQECNFADCGLGYSEDASAFRYQDSVGETPLREWRSWRLELWDYLDAALEQPYPSGSIAGARDTIELHQIEFLIEVRNATGAASIRNFALLYEQ